MQLAIGVDLGGTKTAAGLVDERGRVLERAQAPSGVGTPDRLVASIRDLVRELDREGVRGVGIGAAGLIDYERGHYLYGPNTGLRDLDLTGMLTDALGVEVRMDNDANCAAWAEHRFGAGRGSSHFICVTLGTGIGGGMVLGGRAYRGARGGAGEIGHMLVEPDGVRCGCGRRGCWEQYASGQALERLARRRLSEGAAGRVLELAHGDLAAVRGPMVTAAAREGDALALEVVAEVAVWIGWGLASLINALEPEVIAISGGLVDAWDLFAATVERAAFDRAEAPDRRPMPAIVPAHLGPEAGVVGAAVLFFPEPPAA